MARNRVKLTLLSLSGWKARVANVIVGTPLFGFGGVVILLAVLDSTAPGTAILLILGGIPAVIGLLLYLRALRGDDFTLRLGSYRRFGRDAS
jgi:hypothetical protein